MGLPDLPSLGWAAQAVLGAALLGAILHGGSLRLPAWAGLGALLVIAAGQDALQHRLPLQAHGTEVRVDVLPDGPLRRYEDAVRFSARVVAIAAPDGTPAPAGTGALRRLRLTWRTTRSDAGTVLPGRCLRARVRLRVALGRANPGGGDPDARALVRGLDGVGTVRSGAPCPGASRVEARPSATAARIRAAWAARVEGLLLRGTPACEGAGASPGTCAAAGAVLQALLTGERSAVPRDTADLLRDTGTGHLLAVSGMHVGAAGAAGRLLGFPSARLVALVAPAWGPRVPVLTSLALAAGYALLTGFRVSACRALVMLVFLQVAGLTGRRVGAATRWWGAIVVVLLLWPLAPLDPGFWLSFGAVGVLFLAAARVPARSVGGLLRLQAMLLVGLAPLQAIVDGRLVLAGLLANPLAVPWVGILVLPLGLLAGVLDAVPGGALPATLAATGARLALGGLLALLHLPARLPAPALHAPGWLRPALLVLAIGAVALAGRSRSGCVLLLGALLLRPAALPARPELAWWALDVGQGLAVLVRTPGEVLLYDAGPRFGSWSAGKAVVLPALRALGWPLPDTVVISHGDVDHAGGVKEVLDAYGSGPLPRVHTDSAAVRRALRRRFPDLSPAPCRGRRSAPGAPVRVRFLDAARRLIPPDAPGADNDRSCVLELATPAGRLLLPGDVGRRAEYLLRPHLRRARVVVAPHHGSRTSSGPYLVAATEPRTVVFSAAYRGPFGHPHPEVVQRWREAGARAHCTGAHGAVSGRLGLDPARAAGTGEAALRFRDRGPRWWRRQGSCPGPR